MSIHFANWGDWATACGKWADPLYDNPDQQSRVDCAICLEILSEKA